MNKSNLITIGIILLIAGLVAVIYAQGEINSHDEYTWTEPYTKFENKITTVKNIGIGAMACGGLDILLVSIAHVMLQEAGLKTVDEDKRRLDRLEKLRTQGLITEEEYRQAVSREKKEEEL